jgi:hypothetical protein
VAISCWLLVSIGKLCAPRLCGRILFIFLYYGAGMKVRGEIDGTKLWALPVLVLEWEHGR